MKTVACVTSLIALAATILPAVWFLFSGGGEGQLGLVKLVMLIATVTWFIAAVIWLWRDEPEPIAGVDDDESAVI